MAAAVIHGSKSVTPIERLRSAGLVSPELTTLGLPVKAWLSANYQVAPMRFEGVNDLRRVPVAARHQHLRRA